MGSGDSATLINLLIVVIGYLWTSLALSAVFAKVGEPKGSAWVPIWNLAVLLRLGGYSPWLILIPVVGLVLLVIACYRIGVAFGYGSAMTVVAALWFPIWASVLGWGNAIWSGVVKVPSRIWADEPTPLPRVTYVDEHTDPAGSAPPPPPTAVPPQWTAAPPPPVDGTADSSSVLDPAAAAAEEGNDMIDSHLERTPEPKVVVPKPTPITAVDLVAAAFDRPFDDDFALAPPRPSSPPRPASPPPVAQAPVAQTPVAAPPAQPTPAPEARPQARVDGSDARPTAPTPRPTARPMPQVSEETTQLDQTMLASRFRQQWAIVGRSGDAVVLTGSVAIAGRKPDPLREYPDAQLVVVPDSSRTVSKAHVLLRLVRGVWMVRDLGSTNGVILVAPDGQERLLAPDREEPLTERFFLGDAEFSLVSNA